MTEKERSDIVDNIKNNFFKIIAFLIFQSFGFGYWCSSIQGSISTLTQVNQIQIQALRESVEANQKKIEKYHSK